MLIMLIVYIHNFIKVPIVNDMKILFNRTWMVLEQKLRNYGWGLFIISNYIQFIRITLYIV